MRYNIAFYVHHHGSGHLMRSLAIADKLGDCNLSFLGSMLESRRSVIPERITCINLPMDTATDTDRHVRDREPAGLHYAPLNVKGQLDRTSILLDFFRQQPNTLLVVDVSVEVAMLASLAGIPTIVVRQHGLRTDAAHQIAYHNAIGLLAPYAAAMHAAEENWLREKTFFSGGFSRYDPSPTQFSGNERCLVLLIGSGGTSIDRHFINHLATACPDWQLHVVGKLSNPAEAAGAPNIFDHGHLEDPSELLRMAAVVIGNAGHNTVMEVASLNKRFIVIPEDRPFSEQLEKARLLDEMAAAKVIRKEDLLHVDWAAIVEDVAQSDLNWGDTVAADALDKTAEYLKLKYTEMFGNH